MRRRGGLLYRRKRQGRKREEEKQREQNFKSAFVLNYEKVFVLNKMLLCCTKLSIWSLLCAYILYCTKLYALTHKLSIYIMKSTKVQTLGRI